MSVMYHTIPYSSYPRQIIPTADPIRRDCRDSNPYRVLHRFGRELWTTLSNEADDTLNSTGIPEFAIELGNSSGR